MCERRSERAAAESIETVCKRFIGGADGGDVTAWTLIGRLLAEVR
jgi:hypothetical protein